MKQRIQRSKTLQRGFSSVEAIRSRALYLSGKLYDALDVAGRVIRNVSCEEALRPATDIFVRIVMETLRKNGVLVPIEDNRILKNYQKLPVAEAVRTMFHGFPMEDLVRMRKPRSTVDPGRQGNLMVLKRYEPLNGEKGVILVKYWADIAYLPALYDVVELSRYYRFVLEPSATGYLRPELLLYAGNNCDVLVQAQYPADFKMIERLNLNLVPVPFGAGDWVNHDFFRPLDDGHRPYDIIMVASWLKLKRHALLFAALAKIRNVGLKVAIVGYPYAGRTRADIEREMKMYGVEELCTVYEGVPPENVATLLASSKVNIVLSKKEGAVKALYEGFFCNTPCLVSSENEGIDRSVVNESTGCFCPDHELPDRLLGMVSNYQSFKPREWAMSTTGYCITSRRLNDLIKEAALRVGEPWTHDLVPKVNHSQLRYRHEKDRLAMDEEYDFIAKYLLKPKRLTR